MAPLDIKDGPAPRRRPNVGVKVLRSPGHSRVVPPRFGSSGIRGPYGDPVTPGLALRLGRAVADLGDEAVLGRDARTTSPLLASAVAAGMAAAGTTVRDAGLVPTPTTAFGAKETDLGVHVTASHNPPEDNGFKVFGAGGASIGAEDRARVEELLDGDVDRPATAWDEVGSISEDASVVEDHAEAIARAVDVDDLAGLEVALDGGHGPGGPFTERLLSDRGCEVTTLHAVPDGRFPGRPSEPTPANLEDLTETVRREGLDLGLAHDGDGDRLVAVDGTGGVLSGDELMVLFVRTLDVDRVVVPVNATMALEDACPDVEVVRSRVGDAYVSEVLREGGGGFGGEPSGSWIFPEVSFCPDGPHAALRLAKMVAEAGEPLSALRPDTYPMRRASYPVAEADKAKAIEAFADRAQPLGPVDRTDGVRVEVEDGWGLVRPSGTEPKVRLTVEARDEGDLETIAGRFEEMLEECLP